MKTLAIIAAIASCATPKTPASMLDYRLSHAMCLRTCPVGRYLEPFNAALATASTNAVLADCCVDLNGVGWSSCAWNGAGRFATREQLMDPARLAGDCGGDGYPDCLPDDASP